MSNNSSNVAAVLSGGSNNIENSSGQTSSSAHHVSSNYSASKLSAKAREASEKLIQERKKGILVMVHQYLLDNGYITAAKELAKEIGFNQTTVTSADNIDLETVFVEFEEYYQMKFGKRPKFFRKVDGSISSARSYGTELERDNKNKPYVSSNLLLNKIRQKMTQQQKQSFTPDISATATTTAAPKENSKNSPAPTLPVLKQNSTSSKTTGRNSDNKKTILVKGSSNKNVNTKDDGIDISGKKVLPSSEAEPTLQAAEEEHFSTSETGNNNFLENRILRPLPEEFYFGEMRELAELIRRDILVSNPEVYWDDIAGLSDAKQLIKESVVMPLKYPELFSTIPVLSPWNGVLLFGPPGTGKTMLAKAVATECRTTFFNISASSIVSKWRGDSEKLVRILFDLADHYAPSTIFLDELDSIMSQRQSSGSAGGEHEGSRRMKTELLIQMDGLSKRKGQIFVLAASNLPWDLDQAMLRRLEKRILVGLPDATSRCHIIQKLLGHVDYADLKEQDFLTLSKETENYSGADLALVCKESAMSKLRQVMNTISQYEQQGRDLPVSPLELLKKDKITIENVQTALSVTKPSGNSYQEKYENWKHHYGSNVTI